MHHELQQLSLNCFNYGISSLMKRKTLKTWVMLLLITEVGFTCRASCDYTLPPPQDDGKHLKNTLHAKELPLAHCGAVWRCFWHAAWQSSPTFTSAWALFLPRAPFLSVASKHFTKQLLPHWCSIDSRNLVSLIIWEHLKGIQSSRIHKFSFGSHQCPVLLN